MGQQTDKPLPIFGVEDELVNYLTDKVKYAEWRKSDDKVPGFDQLLEEEMEANGKLAHTGLKNKDFISKTKSNGVEPPLPRLGSFLVTAYILSFVGYAD